ncbi:hypothetical protein ASPVEDRAFT_402588 [Aspergillus versicolor CBS 583.65]|uniref:Zn(2)-C6 fungal-type domain-containing protein n=1 Tax=Aspergillus versicolor CBS 583.65 TaxID=1036611 RepID=A0A1L9Q479_ASPVE|nr:uncharacterized protein ASPVEDRAFT_402588 [Aspergillus versicolor CBS 583.65]OJJ08546.1 hypothetical protein ASPVEDRAFT_402588 [Aspergillus versicolor CBS 583.65]
MLRRPVIGFEIRKATKKGPAVGYGCKYLIGALFIVRSEIHPPFKYAFHPVSAPFTSENTVSWASVGTTVSVPLNIPTSHTSLFEMLPYRSAASACEYCRLHRRRCDRAKPKCSLCVSQGSECVYEQSPDPQPSQLVQELMNVRERLERIAPLVEPPSRQANLYCPALVIKSTHLMQFLGLPSNLTNLLYILERPSAVLSEQFVEHMAVDSADLILHRFYDQIHRWFPVLHSEFPIHFRESNAAGFPPSTTSCVSLLVAALAHISYDNTRSSSFKAALSMLPIVIQEYSVTGIQCLVLFSLYSACLIQPRQAHDYIQSASLKMQPFLKNTVCGQTSPESQLIRRLYWTIHMIQSELSMHLTLSSLGGGMRGHLDPTTLPTNTDLWDWFDASHSPSRFASPDASQAEEAYSPTEANFHFPTEIQMQTLLNKSTSCTRDGPSIGGEIPDPGHSLGPALGMIWSSIVPESHPTEQQIDGAICRAKFHLYEVSTYWPAIYRIIMTGSADPELLPHGPLFFQSLTSFLGSANLALQVCLPKAWFLCANIYIVCIAAIEASEVHYLRLLCQPQLWQQINGSVDAMNRPSMLSPSVQYMRESLKARLEGVRFNRGLENPT